jgi:formylglycine-generating enzyme
MDMAGNVKEWVSDWYSQSYYSSSPSSNPAGPASGMAKVLRGGSFHDNAYYVRTANRNYSDPQSRHYSIGFRCASHKAVSTQP